MNKILGETYFWLTKNKYYKGKNCIRESAKFKKNELSQTKTWETKT